MTYTPIFKTNEFTKHLLVSILVSAIPYALVMIIRDVFPSVMPDRDQLSAYTHLIALIIFAYRYFKLGDYRKNWLYLVVLVFILMMFLEESEFLSEISFFGGNFYFQYRPQFVMEYLENHDMLDTRWRSFHNFFYFMFTQWWKDYFDNRLLSLLFGLNFFALLPASVFVVAERFSKGEENSETRIIRNAGMGMMAVGIIGIVLLANFLSGDWVEVPDLLNGFERILFLISVFAPLIFGALLQKYSNVMVPLIMMIKGRVREKIGLLLLIGILGIIVFTFQIAQAHFEIGHSLVTSRYWITTGSILIALLALFGIVAIGVNGFFRWPLRIYLSRSKQLLLEKPALIYVVVYSLIILFAQLIDWEILSREGQRYIREELIELASAFQLIMAALMVPQNKKS